jgi:hypothetical protein
MRHPNRLFLAATASVALLVILVGLVTLVLPATAGASVDRHTNSDRNGNARWSNNG